MPQSFGSYLRKRIAQRMTVPDFRRAAGISSQYIHAILGNHVPMPLKRVEAFADLLTDADDDRQRFRLACQLTHAPAELRREILRWRPDLLKVPPRPRRATAARRASAR